MRRTITLLLVAMLSAAGCKWTPHRERQTPSASAVREQDTPQPDTQGTAPQGGVSFGDGFAAVVERVAPAVVNVSSTKTIRPPSGEGPFFNDPLLRDFFGGMRGPRPPRELKQQALGSGVIISKDGHVLTN